MGIRDRLAEIDPEILCADGFDDCIIGITTDFVVVYNLQHMLRKLRIRDGMTHSEAEEFFEFNIDGAHVGERTPLYVDTLEQPHGN